MELRDALDQIDHIRQQMARSEMFHGYRAFPVAFSGLLALGVALLQPVWLPYPAENVAAYFACWIGVALLSLLATGWEVAASLRRSHSALERQKTFLAVSQFVPCLIAGLLLLVVLAKTSPESLWLLPGLWSMFFGLGIFASWRFLPQATIWVAVFYLSAGAFCVAWSSGENAFSPWAMGLPFGIGQLLTAAVLYWNLERRHEPQ